MKLLILCSLSAVYIVLNLSCHASKNMNKELKQVIRVGSGGGFVGQENILSILEDGSIQSSGEESYSRLKKPVFEQLKSNITVLGLENIQYNAPGNLYQFVEIPSGGGLRRMAWDPQAVDVPANLKLFFNNVISIIKKNKK